MNQGTIFHRIISAITLTLLLGMAPAPPTRALTGTKIGFKPMPCRIAAGETVDVQVVIADIEHLYGIDARLRFDPKIVEVIDDDPDDGTVRVSPGQFPFPDFVAKNQVDNDAGTIWYAVTQLAPREAASGTGIAMTVRFRGIAPGVSPLPFHELDVVDECGLPIHVQPIDGEITVTAPPTAPPPTLSPMQRTFWPLTFAQ